MARSAAVFSVMLDCNDLDLMVGFWSEVLGLQEKRRFPGFAFLSRMGGTGPGLAFQQVPEPKTTKNRMHLDLVVDDPEVFIGGVLRLGATRLADHEMGGFCWTVLGDPEGNESCVAPRG